jgi:hypothetical protein
MAVASSCSKLALALICTKKRRYQTEVSASTARTVTSYDQPAGDTPALVAAGIGSEVKVPSDLMGNDQMPGASTT